MKKILRFCYALLLLFISATASFSQTSTVKKTVFQAFWWDFWNNNFKNGWSDYLTELAPRLKSMGFDAIWIPPSYKNQSTGFVGYGPFDLYDLGDKYQKGGSDSLNIRTRMGTKDELLRMIGVMHANGIEVIQDIVLNHNDGAGANNGAGGQDTEPTYSMINASGFKNFRFSCYAMPLLDDGQNDYWTRNGRWPKNYQNFYPNPNNNCTTGDICSAFFGPDLSYESNAIGQSSNIPTSGMVTINGITRPYYNPPQSNNHNRQMGRDWIGWFKKQTGVDGWRWDAVKHFPVFVQEDYIYFTKYLLPTFAAGGQDMFCIGEWIGNKTEVDNYVTAVQTGSSPGGVTNEKHTGTFDFSYRGYGPNGGIYSMVLGLGGYNMQNLPGEQQNQRFMDYPGGKRVYRTSPFVNSHDTYRPYVDASGNFTKPLGDASGWNTGQELGGNGQHIDPREPRLAAAYAAISAIDGNPIYFFEDLFDVGTTGKRYSHLPSSATDLPARTDLQNVLQAHQRIDFKSGNYAVPSSLTGSDAPFYQKGSSGDHLVIERIGKAIIGVTDFFNTAANNSQDQEVYVTVDASWIGKQLYDWSGAHGITTSQVFNDRRVLISTAPVGHTIPGAYGHGYSVWAPAPAGVIITSVADLYNYLGTYAPPRAAATTIEWEMADDLGDSHCKSLGYGGRLPDNSTKQRTAGKVFTDAGKATTLKIFPQNDGFSLTAGLYDLDGNLLAGSSGPSSASSPLTINYTTAAAGWVVVKVRSTTASLTGQKVFANLVYTAPQVINTRSAANSSATRVAIWTGNKNTTDATDCGNWEEGKLPDASTNVIIPASSSPNFPQVTGVINAKDVTIENGASLAMATTGQLNVHGNWINQNTAAFSVCGTISFRGSSLQTVSGTNTFCKLEVNNAANVTHTGATTISQELQLTNGKYVLGNFDLTLAPAAIITGGSAGSYVQTGNVPGTGSFLVKTVTTTPSLFPVGNNNYTPATITNNGPQTTFSIRCFESVLQNGTSGAPITASGKILKTWVINPLNTNTFADITLQWNSANSDGLDLSNCFVAKNQGGAGQQWNALSTAGPATGTNPYTRTATNVTNFSKFSVFSNGTILPVNILSFSGYISGSNALLNWYVSGQVNVAAYHIEKSFDGQHFSQAGTVSPQSGAGVIAYHFTDANFDKPAYYRIISVDADGSKKSSAVVYLKTMAKPGIVFSIAPNPVKNAFKLLADVRPTGNINVMLFAANGKKIAAVNNTLENVNTALNTQLQNQPPGIYMLQIISAESNRVLRIIKQ